MQVRLSRDRIRARKLAQKWSSNVEGVFSHTEGSYKQEEL